MKNSIYIIIPVHNRLEYTRKCLLSIREQTYRNYIIVIIDDGSTDGTLRMLESEFPEVVIICGDGKLWWTKATNRGVEYALRNKADFILTLNNDTILPCDYLQIALASALKHPRSIIGSVALDNSEKICIVDAGVKINWLTGKYKNMASIMNDSYSHLEGFIFPDVLPGRGTLIPTEVFHTVGYFDDIRFPHYAADQDFSLRARNRGYNLIIPKELRLISFPKMSGLGNTNERVTLQDTIYSFFSIRSSNHLSMRVKFGYKHAPLVLIPSFIVLDLLRVILGMLIKRTKYFIV